MLAELHTQRHTHTPSLPPSLQVKVSKSNIYKATETLCYHWHSSIWKSLKLVVQLLVQYFHPIIPSLGMGRWTRHMLTFSLANATWHETRPTFSSLRHPAFRAEYSCPHCSTQRWLLSDGGRPTCLPNRPTQSSVYTDSAGCYKKDCQLLNPWLSTSSGLFFFNESYKSKTTQDLSY